MFYPSPLRHPVGHRFTVDDVVRAGALTVEPGTPLVLLVEGEAESSVQTSPPHTHAGEPFDLSNDRLRYVGPGPGVAAPVPVNEELRWTPVVEDAALRHRVPIPVLLGLVFVESRWSPTAQSPTGPLGLMQFTRRTAEGCGLSLSPRDERLDPEKAAPAGAAYLRRLYQRFPEAVDSFEQFRFALAAYNQGRGAVNGAIRAWMSATGTPAWPPERSLRWADVAARWDQLEGRRYVERILGGSGPPDGVAAQRYGYGQ